MKTSAVTSYDFAQCTCTDIKVCACVHNEVKERACSNSEILKLSGFTDGEVIGLVFQVNVAVARQGFV